MNIEASQILLGALRQEAVLNRPVSMVIGVPFMGDSMVRSPRFWIIKSFWSIIFSYFLIHELLLYNTKKNQETTGADFYYDLFQYTEIFI